MKVLFLSAANSIHTVRWVNSLAKRNITIYLVSLKNHSEDKRNKISNDVKVIYLPFKGEIGYYLNYLFFKKIIKNMKPDIINAHYLSGYGTLARLVNFKKTLVNVWGSDIYDFPKQNLLKNRIIEKNLSKINYIASTSNAMGNEIKKYLKIDKKINIVPFGINTSIFAPKNKEQKNKKELIIGIVKSLEEIYGIEYLIRAFKILTEQNKQLKLVIYGEGKLKQSLKNLTKELKIEHHVEFKGYISNSLVPEVLNKIDIFVVPSNSESFGVSAVEAMACGIPVVASDADGFNEIIENGKTGYIVPKRNEKELAKKIDLLVKDEALRNKIGKQGRIKVKSTYEWEKNVDKMVEIYERIINN